MVKNITKAVVNKENMCGIFGAINYSVEVEKEIIYASLKHRGPEYQGYNKVKNVELYHARLAIQELNELGRQPMEHNGLHIVFNGEIYNHKDLRTKYQLRSESSSDTMTILLLYEKLGIEMLSEFDGMFAFCLYDSNRGLVFFARDRAGKKPLYIWQNKQELVFSSELNALRKVLPLQVNKNVISDYLYLGYNYQSITPYENVREVSGGTYIQLNISTNEQKEVKWFDIYDSYRRTTNISKEEALEQLDHYLHLAVKRRIESSDLDVGAFLSGGIDSGLITAVASDYNTRIKTFTVRMPGAYDESQLAELVAKKYQTKHHTIDVSFDNLQKDFVNIVSNYGEPFFDSSAIPSYYVSKAAKEHITVVLNGDGADELFGGYRRYVPFQYLNFFDTNSTLKNGIGILSKLLPVAHEKKSKYNYIYRLAQLASYKDSLKIYNASTSDLLVGFEDQFLKPPVLTDIREMLDRVNSLPISSLNKVLLADFNALLFSDLLPKMDIATMAHSLEGRSPFLSKEMLEFAPPLPDQLKVKGTTTKVLLRALAQKYLPQELIHQPKRGFEIPLKNWVENDLKPIIEDAIYSSDPFYTEFIDPIFIRNLYEKKLNVSDEKRAKILYSILCLEVWSSSHQKKPCLV
jgi:asparagine synthase (glutamine-hydrolysing)